MKKIIVLIVCLFPFIHVIADEGMWLPHLLKQLNAEEMYIKGLKIPVEDIYSVNKNSLKDAVVLFNGNCTGEMISNEGLLLTNHHCGFSSIQAQSSLEHNYLRDGFWAMKKSEELPCPGVTAVFIIRMEDVTSQIIPFLNEVKSESERNARVKELVTAIEKKAVEGTHYDAQVKAIFEGNEYILIVSEKYKDIRMVGAPPSTIGNFGGETDNWMWPRHTGDFSMFRVYANKENMPADYNPENIPFKPRSILPISLKGVNENDFTMVYGFPGKTQEYIPSYAVDITMNISNPNKIAIRDKKIAVMENFMQRDEKVFIQYAAKLRSLANAYKKWKGETSGLKKMDALQTKRSLEADFNKWSSQSEERGKEYGTVVSLMADIYNDYQKYTTASDYYAEAGLGIEIISYANGFTKLVELASAENPDQQKIDAEVARLLKAADSYFKNYHAPLDEKLMIELCNIYMLHVDQSLLPPLLVKAKAAYNGDLGKYASMVFRKSYFVSNEKVKEMLNQFTNKKVNTILKDPAYLLASDIVNTYNLKVGTTVLDKKSQLAPLNRLFVKGILAMQEGRKHYPDANSTLRVSHGTVSGYNPRDGVHYKCQTFLDGVFEKMDSSSDEFNVPPRLMELYLNKDYGRYATNGKMPLAFIASNHTTGGMSGSPVLDANGKLIGINFDRVWEATMSDIMYSPEQCRNITLDVRYILFVIDKFAGAGHLVKEMVLVE